MIKIQCSCNVADLAELAQLVVKEQGKSIFKSVPLLEKVRKLTMLVDAYSVPEQLLRKHRLNHSSTFVYFNQGHLDGFTLPGELLLMGLLYEGFHKDIEGKAMHLFRPSKFGLDEFLVENK